MAVRQVYTSEQLQRLSSAHKEICAMRNVDPSSADGRNVAARLLDECTEVVSAKQIVRRFTH